MICNYGCQRRNLVTLLVRARSMVTSSALWVVWDVLEGGYRSLDDGVGLVTIGGLQVIRGMKLNDLV